MRARCRTNLDGYENELWPTEFLALPRNGDCVQARSGKYLKVCRVTHAMDTDRSSGPLLPIIIVELTKPVMIGEV